MKFSATFFTVALGLLAAANPLVKRDVVTVQVNSLPPSSVKLPSPASSSPSFHTFLEAAY